MTLNDWSIIPCISGGRILHLGHLRAMVTRMLGYGTSDLSSEDILHAHLQVIAIDWIVMFRYLIIFFWYFHF
jgi:hypothetical protein